MANYPNLQLFIDGEWKSRDGQPVLNPADDSVLGTVPHATRADLDAALEAAEKGFKVWSRTASQARRDHPQGCPAHARAHRELAVAMTLSRASRSPSRGWRSCALAKSSNGTPRRAAASTAGSSRASGHAPFLCASRSCRRRFLAVELPDEFARPQGGRRAVGRLLDHPQSLGGDAGRRGPAGEGLRRCRPAARRAEPGVRQARRDLGIPHPPAGRAAGDLHRLGSRRQASHGVRRRA